MDRAARGAVFGDRWAAGWIALLGVPYLGIVGGWLWENLATTGTLSGGVRQAAKETALENLSHLIDSFVTLLPTSFIGYGVALLTAGAIWLGFYLSKTSWVAEPSVESEGDDRSESVANRTLLIWWGAAALLYLFVLWVMRTQTDFDQINVRFIAPAFPLLWCAIAILPTLFSPEKRISWGVALLVLISIFLPSVRGVDQLFAAKSSWAFYGTPAFPVRKEMLGVSYTSKMQNTLPRREFVIARRAIIQRFVTRQNVLETPSSFDQATLSQLNALPEGSVMAVESNALKALLSVAEELEMEVDYQEMGEHLLVVLPLRPTESL